MHHRADVGQYWSIDYFRGDFHLLFGQGHEGHQDSLTPYRGFGLCPVRQVYLDDQEVLQSA